MRDLPGSPAAFERAAGLAGPDATVQAARELARGTHARTRLIRTANPELEVVVREFPAGDESARREALVLAALDACEAACGAALPGRLWSDLRAVARSRKTVETWVPNYRDLGRGDLTARQLRDRHAPWTAHLLAGL
jgi:hypothetical protein